MDMKAVRSGTCSAYPAEARESMNMCIMKPKTTATRTTDIR